MTLGRDNQVVAGQRGWESKRDDAVAAARERLVGRSHGAVAVEELLSYGAVDIDTGNAVVWVLLAASDDQTLPAWFAPADGEWSADPQQAALDPAFVSWMRGLREEVRSEFSRRGWPSAGSVSVLFDSSQRVQERGWHYFNE